MPMVTDMYFNFLTMNMNCLHREHKLKMINNTWQQVTFWSTSSEHTSALHKHSLTHFALPADPGGGSYDCPHWIDNVTEAQLQGALPRSVFTGDRTTAESSLPQPPLVPDSSAAPRHGLQQPYPHPKHPSAVALEFQRHSDPEPEALEQRWGLSRGLPSPTLSYRKERHSGGKLRQELARFPGVKGKIYIINYWLIPVSVFLLNAEKDDLQEAWEAGLLERKVWREQPFLIV